MEIKDKENKKTFFGVKPLLDIWSSVITNENIFRRKSKKLPEISVQLTP